MSRFEDAHALVGKKVRLDTPGVTATGLLKTVYEDGKLYLDIEDGGINVVFALNDEDLYGLTEVLPTFEEILEAKPNGTRIRSVGNEDTEYVKFEDMWYRAGYGQPSSKFVSKFWELKPE